MKLNSRTLLIVFLVLLLFGIVQVPKGQDNMTDEEFWSIIHTGRVDQCEQKTENLVAMLEKLSAEQIIDFDRHLQNRLVESYRWDLWAVSYILNGGSSDDDFEYFRAWLIGKGEQAFEAALEDPRAAAEYFQVGDVAECENLLYSSSTAYKTVTGEDLPTLDTRSSEEPSGEPWEEEDLPDLYPELVTKFW